MWQSDVALYKFVETSSIVKDCTKSFRQSFDTLLKSKNELHTVLMKIMQYSNYNIWQIKQSSIRIQKSQKSAVWSRVFSIRVRQSDVQLQPSGDEEEHRVGLIASINRTRRSPSGSSQTSTINGASSLDDEQVDKRRGKVNGTGEKEKGVVRSSDDLQRRRWISDYWHSTARPGRHAR